MTRNEKLQSIESANDWRAISDLISLRYYMGILYRREYGLATLAGYRILRTDCASALATKWLEDLD